MMYTLCYRLLPRSQLKSDGRLTPSARRRGRIIIRVIIREIDDVQRNASPRRETLLGLYDRLAATADAATLLRCERNFLISSRYEWQFWDAAYRRETWPI